MIPRAMPELLMGRALKWFIANNKKASGNRYFTFAHDPLVLFSPGASRFIFLKFFNFSFVNNNNAVA